MRHLGRTAAISIVGLAALVLAATGTPGKPVSEEAYVRELSRLHATDEAAALDYAKKGDAWYASTGPLAEARKAMTVTLLVDLGNMDEARRMTRAFIAAFPNSPYLPLVEGVTGIHPRPHGPRSHQ